MVGTVKGAQRYALAHSISAGARLEVLLFAQKVIGRYRYLVEEKN